MTRSQAAAAAVAGTSRSGEEDRGEAGTRATMETEASYSRASESTTMQRLLAEVQLMRQEREREQRGREQERQELHELRRQAEERRQNLTGQFLPLSSQIMSKQQLKVDIFDGTGSIREYFCQFELIAWANNWNGSDKAVQLAAKLRGRAREVLINWEEVSGYDQLKAKLELRFGDHIQQQNSYVHFSNRKQKPGEDFASRGDDLEQLARIAYPECTSEVREKILCAQFIAAISDGFIKRTLQLENIVSL